MDTFPSKWWPTSRRPRTIGDVNDPRDVGPEPHPANESASVSTQLGRADAIAAELSRRIASGDIPLGSWLRQSKIAAGLGTSRTPVREAIRILCATGVAEFVPQRGARVRVPTRREIEDGYLVRAELEGLAAELAARFATQQLIDRMLEAEALFAEALDEVTISARGEVSPVHAGKQRWIEANDAFHEIILHAARNKTLESAIEWVHLALPRNLTWNELSRDPRLMRINIEQHRAIREAIERADGPAARAAMVAHVVSSGELVLLGLGSRD